MEYKSGSIDGIDPNTFYANGYKGIREMQHATGNLDEVLQIDKASSYPWIYILDRSKVTTDEANNTGTETYAFQRDFLTSLSNIPIKAEEVIRVIVGYKMYVDNKSSSPKAKGYSGETLLEWEIIEARAMTLLTATGLAMTAALLSF